MTEAELQKQCEEYIKKLGWDFLHLGHRGKSRKGYSARHTGYPDLIIFAPRGNCFFVELKVGNNYLSYDQIQKQSTLGGVLGYKVYNCNSFDGFKKIIDNERGN